FKLNEAKRFVYQTSEHAITIVDGNFSIGLKNKNFSLRFSKENGNIESYEVKGKEIFKEGPQINFWRPPTDNDFGAELQKKLVEWKDSAKTKFVSIKYELRNDSGWAKVIVERSLFNGDASLTQTFSVDGGGTLKVETDLKA